ncbi:MAG: hypothetical protein FWC03_04755 [Treponema sp.]|nr:hypothetical protein [Treponema sp.]
MKKLCLIILASMLFSGCYTTPSLSGIPANVAEGTYALNTRPEYIKDPKHITYAVNTWVKEQGYTSYDLEVIIVGKMANCYITVPGSTPVEDLPVVKYFDKNKTISAIVGPSAGAIWIILLLIIYLL